MAAERTEVLPLEPLLDALLVVLVEARQRLEDLALLILGHAHQTFVVNSLNARLRLTLGFFLLKGCVR